ncbi:DNA protecting protein DprA [Subtercola boreus]|uniref:DNA protecting protein DprA n=1 Tax=Subtercola boreus TaxID=120213 RepID=A0A3E0VBH0_9MICO|nr:DNA-processing protein DprA [Subtercola boreus]RFA06848.1 DNA protecting protein DprA [Subtercola boreus]
MTEHITGTASDEARAPQADSIHDEDTIARVAWACITEPGDVTRGALITAHGAAEALRLLISNELEGDEITALRNRVAGRYSPDVVAEAITRTKAQGFQILTPSHEHWPAGLTDLGDTAPVCLWVRGNAALLSTRSIAIVGARAATGYGENVTMTLTQGLVDNGWTIVSGAAYGIDGMAHRTALASRGNTVAVLAGGVDRYYPSGNDSLLSRIADAGAIVSETPPGTAPTKWRFLQRNRTIATIAHKTIVVEAGSRSGSLDTAAHALAIGRPVGAVPGPITSAASSGCHRLIQEFGATLITSAADADTL